MRQQRAFSHIDLSQFSVQLKVLDRIQFDSRSEVAAAVLLEKYCPYRTIQGHSYQIPVGNKKVDFLVEGHLVEYHPIILSHEFGCRTAFSDLSHALRHLPEATRSKAYTALESEFGNQYYKRRRHMLDASDAFKDTPLIVCHNQEAFCKEVIKRFATEPTPHLQTLVQMFNKLRKHY